MQGQHTVLKMPVGQSSACQQFLQPSSEVLSYQMQALELEAGATESKVAASCTGQNPGGVGSSSIYPDPTQASTR